MKHLGKIFVLALLNSFARMRLARMQRHGVQIIGVTGSVGKTTCKEAVAHVLRGQFRVLCSEKSYNTDFGLPLTILELKSEFSSMYGWIKNLVLAMWCGLFDRAIYDILVLEMGVDKPGDMDVLLRMATPDIAIYTGVHPIHLADGQFTSLDAIFLEKVKLVKAISSSGTVFLNGDDERCMRLGAEMNVEKNGPKVVLFGSNDGVKLCAGDIKSRWGSISFSVKYGEVKGDFSIPIFGTQHVSSLLPSIGCGLLFGMYMPDIVDRLSSFTLPPGRLSLIEGLHDSWIIDSSYNASPDAVRAALETMGEMAQERRREEKSSMRKIFLFGNMNELGSVSEKEHRGIAAYLKDRVDVLVTVGEMAAMCRDETVRKNILDADQTHAFMTTDEATSFMQTFVQPGDLILVKGSQNNIRLERLVKAIMKRPELAGKLLARQDWKS